jgi:anti-sigma28 factor (negative regulator of flagellin synthesis)
MKLRNLFNEHSSEFYTGCAIGGLIMSVIFGAKATVRAVRKVEKRKEELGVEKLSVWETIKVAGPCYILTGLTMGLTTYTIVKPVSDEMKKGQILATSLMISEEARRSFEEATNEVVGEHKVEEIRDKIAKDRYNDTPVAVSSNKKPGEKIFVETLVNHEFYLKDTRELDILEKDMELDIVNYNFVSLNDWLYRLHIPAVDEAIGELGWGPGNGFSLKRTWIENDYGEPVCLITHTTPPLPRKQAEGCWGA